MTRVKLHPHPKERGFYVAHVAVPMVVGDIPGATRVSCIADTKSGALAAAAALAQTIAMDPTIGAVIPDGTFDDMEALKYLASCTRQGVSALKAAVHLMPSQRGLARILADEARAYGDATSLDDGQSVAGFFDDIASLATKVASSVVNVADPDHWPKWMQKLAKPMGRYALDAAATAVLGPAGPVMVESAMAIYDKAQSGDPDAAKQIENIAKKALDGDKKAKVLMSAVGTAAASTSKDAKAATLGDAADDYMARWGGALQPEFWGGDNTGPGGDGYGYDPGAMLSPSDVMQLQAAAAYGNPYAYGYPQGYDDGSGYGPQYGDPSQAADDTDAQEAAQPWSDADPNVRLHASPSQSGVGPRGGGVNVTKGSKVQKGRSFSGFNGIVHGHRTGKPGGSR